ncbi:L,D-transpeptidase family protein [Aestuariivita sp.]|jgi:murein L,D-transpeptidase YafK|uniref:L,D-transpeptidase family protein n=1 Tax=Aestuariivita sp. TaxID=1872407 RepID=UPI0021722E04|nr:L,D-transpeptidase family protein [Aestuariivita sp.]MCE8005484.1 L,D-transpeptidase family protein [Aestuariivita sp.]
MKRRTFGVLLASAAAVSVTGCSQSKFRTYRGPDVTSIVANKGARKMYLLHGQRTLKEYSFDLGFAPVGDKKVEGDGKTPEGTYIIDRRNPNSRFHLSLGVSYPNAEDIAEAAALGKPPGGDIFIHGQPNAFKAKGPDWTWGCIAVTNREIEDIYAMVRNGTVISIRA